MNLPVDSLLQGGKYRIVRFISSGGFGCTYEAEHVMLEKRVAIKEFFVRDFCNRDEATARVTVGTLSKKGLVEKLRRKFIDEAKGLCKLRHPGIVRVSDVFEENGTAYFVMDYIEGRSLNDVVKQEGPLPEARALNYIRYVADALQYVHGQNRLHLDVKPGNIMLDGEDRAVLIDFGASKQYDEQDGENTSTLLGKTPGYAPLEQMGNDVVKFMPATDIYALGATLYKLLTGITPPSATLLASGEPLAPLPAAVGQATRRALTAAMETNRNKRPQTVKAFLELLDDTSAPAPAPAAGESEETEPTTPRPAQHRMPKATPAAATFGAAAEDTEETLPTGSRTAGPTSGGSTPGQPAPPSGKKKGWLWGVLSAVVVAAAVFGIGSLLNHGENATPAPTDSLALVDSTALPAPEPTPNPAPSVSAEPEYGTLKVESTPAGAAIWLDGRNTKKTTPEILEEIAPGSHRVVLKLDGYQDITKSVTVKKDERTTCTLTLKEVAQPTPAPAQTTTPAPAPAPAPSAASNGWTKTKNGYKTTYTNGSVSFTMVAVAGGTFTMGATREQGSDAYDDEKPAHDVTLSSFSIGETEVTQALWQAVMGSNPSSFTGNLQRPVETVSYNDCKTFISRLNSLTGENFRLPTEAEWEFAARGGNRSQGYKYSGSNSLGSVAWYTDNSGGTTHAVKTKSPNELGLYDMSGNVWEWCNDWFGSYSSNSQTNPRGAQSGSSRVIRGGGWFDYAWYCRVASRLSSSPGDRSPNCGVRLAL